MQHNLHIARFVQSVPKGVLNLHFFIIDCSKKVVTHSQSNVIHYQNIVVIKTNIGLGINGKAIIFIYYACNEIRMGFLKSFTKLV